MTRTPRLGLYRWEPEDFVDLEQVNANFDALEQAGGDANQAAVVLRHELAHEALWKYHKNDLSPQLQNLVVMDLSRESGEALALSQLQDVHGTPRLISAVEPGFTASVEKQTLYNHNAQGEATLHSFTPTGYGKLVSIKLPLPANSTISDHLFIRVYDDVGLLYESARFEYKTGATERATVALDCPISAGREHQIRICRDASYSGSGTFELAAGTIEVTTAGTVYESGSFQSREFALSEGTTLGLWVYYTGTAPEVALSTDGGAFTALAHEKETSAPGLDGTVCTCRSYRASGQGGHSMRLRFTLTGSDSVVREACGWLL